MKLRDGIWVLALNDMRFSNIETTKPICCADTLEELAALLDRERVPHYREGKWGKNFRKGGPLEWCNAPFALELERHAFQWQAPELPHATELQAEGVLGAEGVEVQESRLLEGA